MVGEEETLFMDNTKYVWYNDTNLKETEGIGIR